jgi:4-hydroxy-tetrahydrodipicolinate synthase
MFKGSLVAIVTPFLEEGIDILALQKLINLQIEAHTDGIVIAGSTGEGTLLTKNERTTLIKETVKAANKKIPIIVGCSASSTWETIELSKEAQELGADGVLIMTPFYVKPSETSVIEHFKKIEEAISLPIIVYNHPTRSGVNLSVETILELFKLNQVVALKDSNTDMTRVKKLSAALQNTNKTLLSGDDETVIDYLKAGGKGCISVTANIVPKKSKEMMDAWFKGDQELAKNLNDELMPLHKATMCEPNPQTVKYALFKMGLIQPILRMPLVMPTIKGQQIMDNTLDDIVK